MLQRLCYQPALAQAAQDCEVLSSSLAASDPPHDPSSIQVACRLPGLLPSVRPQPASCCCWLTLPDTIRTCLQGLHSAELPCSAEVAATQHHCWHGGMAVVNLPLPWV